MTEHGALKCVLELGDRIWKLTLTRCWAIAHMSDMTYTGSDEQGGQATGLAERRNQDASFLGAGTDRGRRLVAAASTRRKHPASSVAPDAEHSKGVP